MGESRVRVKVRGLGRIAGAVAFAATVVLAACTKSTTPIPIATIQLQPGLDSVEIGQTFSNWIVTLRDAQGDAITGRALTWESQRTEIATVDENGVVTGVNSGETLITVRAEGKSAQAAIRVLKPILSVVATPDSFDLPMSTNRTIVVQLVGPGGEALTGRTITWATSNATIAAVSPGGLVTPISLGTVTVTAYAGGKQANVRVRVVAEPVASVRILPLQSVHVVRLGQAIQLTAQCLNAAQQVLTGRPIVWNSSNPLVASIGLAGLVSGTGVGQATITATCDNVPAQVQVQVTLVPVSSVSISPAGVNLLVGGPGQQLSATARDSANNVLSLQGRSVNWTSDNLPVASVSGQGVVNAVSAGLARITAQIDGTSSPSINVNVQNAPVASVVITVPPQVKLGNQHQMVVTLRDQFNNVLSGRQVTWTSSSPAIATIDPSGIVLALSVGTTTITASSEGIQHSVQLTVIP